MILPLLEQVESSPQGGIVTCEPRYTTTTTGHTTYLPRRVAFSCTRCHDVDIVTNTSSTCCAEREIKPPSLRRGSSNARKTNNARDGWMCPEPTCVRTSCATTSRQRRRRRAEGRTSEKTGHLSPRKTLGGHCQGISLVPNLYGQPETSF